MLEKRRIEAEILKHVYETVMDAHGKPAALAVVREAVKRSAIEQGQRLAAEVSGQTSLQTFFDLQPRWTADHALEIEVLAKDDTAFDFNVTRCRYAEMYREMGLGDIGHLLSCNRDGTFCEGYDRNLDLTRTQTLMQGASHCDFRYRYKAD
jgi:hypothetical protein